MSAQHDGGPAFPVKDHIYGPNGSSPSSGLSLRDWFAGQAIGQLLETCRGDNRGVGFAEFVAAKSYEIADAMLKAREVRS